MFHSAVRLVKIVILQTALAAKRMCRCLSALKIHTERRCGSFAAHWTIGVTADIFCPTAAFQTTPRIVCWKIIQLFTAYLTGIPCFKCKAFVYQPPESCAAFKVLLSILQKFHPPTYGDVISVSSACSSQCPHSRNLYVQDLSPDILSMNSSRHARLSAHLCPVPPEGTRLL